MAQTKIMNEGWACLRGDSLVLTEHGLLRYDILHDLLAYGEAVTVSSGNGRKDAIVDRHIRRHAATIRLRTRRGLVLEGAEEHKLSIGPDQWTTLKDVKVGQLIPLSVGDNIWPEQLVSVSAPARIVAPAVADMGKAARMGANTMYGSSQTSLVKDRIATAIESKSYQFGKADKPAYNLRFPLVADRPRSLGGGA